MKPSDEIMFKAGVPKFNGIVQREKCDEVPVRNLIYALFAYIDETYDQLNNK